MRHNMVVSHAMGRILGGILVAAAFFAPAAAQAKGCGFPGTDWTQVAPATQQMDAARLATTMNWATEHDSASIAVYRHGCLVAQSAVDGVTGTAPIDGWSMTKSVSSLLVGRAV